MNCFDTPPFEEFLILGKLEIFDYLGVVGNVFLTQLHTHPETNRYRLKTTNRAEIVT